MGVSGALVDGAWIELEPCNTGSDQSFSFDFDGRLTAGGFCVTALGSDDGADLYLTHCGANHHRFRLLTDGRVLGPDARCIDVEWASSANGTRIQIWECVDVTSAALDLRATG